MPPLPLVVHFVFIGDLKFHLCLVAAVALPVLEVVAKQDGKGKSRQRKVVRGYL